MDPHTTSAVPRRRRSALRGFGPGLVITASFVGPGTVTTATVTGASYGYVLLWAILFSVPVIALFLFIVMNQRSLLGVRRNQLLGNILGGIVLLVVAVLGAYQLGDVIGLFPGSA